MLGIDSNQLKCDIHSFLLLPVNGHHELIDYFAIGVRM